MSPAEFFLNLSANIAGEIAFAILAVVAGLVAFRYRKAASVYRALVSQMWVGRKTTSPDGRSTAHEANGEIYITEKSGRITNLTHHPALDIRPMFSPDGRWLAFQSNRDGGDRNVYVVDIASQKTVQITKIKGTERAIGWDMTGQLYVDLGGSLLVVKSIELENKLK